MGVRRRGSMFRGVSGRVVDVRTGGERSGMELMLYDRREFAEEELR